MRHEPITDRARGRWRSILPALGVPAGCLVNRHGPCPACGGTDRFRFDDKAGNGTFYCNGCGAGDGVGLVMRVRCCDYREAVQMIEALLPSSTFQPVRAAPSYGAVGAALWASGRALTGTDPASRYLARRGFVFDTPPSVLKFLPNAKFTAADRITTSRHPAMIARFDSPDGTEITCHLTYLTSDGRKADVLPAKKLAPGAVPPGGSVRLAPAGETIGIAEGIETALAASRLFNLPVWAALTAGAVTKWQPPSEARHLLIFADNDRNYAGQSAAYALAHRLAKDRDWSHLRIEVRPNEVADQDWADVWLACTNAAGATADTALQPTDQRPDETDDDYVTRIFGGSPASTSSQLEVIS